jgi:hypothetical protein
MVVTIPSDVRGTGMGETPVAYVTDDEYSRLKRANASMPAGRRVRSAMFTCGIAL